MKRAVSFFLLIFVLLLGGCVKAPTGPICRVVTEIQVTAQQDGRTATQVYSDPESMKSILNYLRLLDPYVKTDIDPETFRADTYEIIVRYSDGDHTTYRQIYSEYLQKDGGPWKRITPKSDLLFPAP